MSNSNVDWEALFNQKKESILSQLKQRHQNEVIDVEGTIERKYEPFIKKIAFEKDNITEQNIEGFVKRNPFKEDLLRKFKSITSNKSETIADFVIFEIPILRKEHKEKLLLNKNAYEYDVEFLEASIESIIEMIAKVFVYKSFLSSVYNTMNKDLGRSGPQMLNSDSQPGYEIPKKTKIEEETRSLKKIVLLLCTLDKVYNIDEDVHNHKGIRTIIHFVSGLSSRNIDDAVREYYRDNGAVHKSYPKNHEDYLDIQKILQKLNNQKINSEIEGMIKKFKQ